MSIKKLSFMLLSALSLAALLNGCGSSSKEGTTSTAALDAVAKVDEKTCAQCHGSSYSSQSGIPIYSEYVQSKHFQNSAGIVVGCQGCHGGGAQHNGVGPMPYSNPDSAGKCFKCHQPAFLGTYNTGGTPTAIEMAHFYNITGAGVHPAMYATKNFQNNCTACHEPHNPLLGRGAAERKAWASEGHGDINSTAFATEDFKQNTSCIRCHTSTGYSNFLAGLTGGTTGPWSDPFPVKSWATPGDNGREVVTCRTCHFNDSFNANSIKSAPAFVAPYNSNKNPKTFPDVAQSNLCIACHSARESGDSVAAITDFSNASFKNSHYKSSAANMYMANAFINFTTLTAPAPSNTEGSTFSSAKSYAQTLLPDNTSVPTYGISGGTTSAHRKLGTPLITGTEDYLNFPAVTSNPAAATAISTNGPCVTCHLQAYNAIPGLTAGLPAVPAVRPAHGHSWQIDANAANQLCLPCHGDPAPGHLDGGNGLGVAKYTLVNSLATLQSAMLVPQSAAFQNGLNLIQQILLVKYMIKFDQTAYPYFYDLQKDPSGKTAVKDWTRKSVAGVTDAASIALGLTPIPAGGFIQKQASRVMGACFNFNLLTREPGAYLHARTFSQRLVYDAVDFLDDNKMNFTALTTARVLNPGVYSGKEANVLIAAPVGGLATESMAWLAGTHYSDSKGQTSVPLKLRP